MRRSALAAAGLAVAVAVLPAAAKPRSGLSSTDLLGKPSGTRFIGLGQTGAGLAGSPSSPLYNVASLQDLSGAALEADFQIANQSDLPEEVILGASPLGDKKLTFLSFAGPGRAVFFRPLADFDETVVAVATDPANNYDQDSVRVNQFGIAASQAADKGYAVGLGLSYLGAQRGYARARTGEAPVLELANGNGFAVDWGFRDRKGYVSYGLAIQNFPGLIYWDRYEPDQLPTLARTGFAFQPAPAFAFFTDYEKRFYVDSRDDPDRWHFGLEFAPVSWLALRGGAESENFNDKDKTAYAWGLTTGSPQGHALDLGTRVVQLTGEAVYEYYLSLTWPLARGSQDEPRRRRAAGPR